jgi:competence protein ComEC
MHIATLTALLGILSGVAFCEKLLFSTEVAMVSFLIGFVSSIFAGLKMKKERPLSISEKEESFSIGVIRVQFVEPKHVFVCESSCTFEARVMRTPTIQDAYQVVDVLPYTQDETMYVRIKAPLYPKLSVGETVTLSGVVTSPKLFIPHNGENVFEYETYLALHGIGSVMSYPHIERANKNDSQKKSVAEVRQIQEKLVRVLTLYVDDPASSLASGMLFGDSSMRSDLVQTFRVAGLSHVVVLSGFNITILISFILFVCMFLPLSVRVITACVAIVFFVVMVGGEVSVIRAMIMSFISLGALLLGRGYAARQALLLSLLCIIIYEPAHLLSDVSLHLSFLATAGIIYLSEGLTKRFMWIRFLGYREIVVTTCAAYVATLPYLMYTFGTVSVYALLTNMIALPLVPLMMLMAFLVLVGAYVSPSLGTLFGYLCTILGESIIFVAQSVESLPLASVSVSISFRMMLCIYGVGVILFYYVVLRKKNETLLTKNDEILSEVITY